MSRYGNDMVVRYKEKQRVSAELKQRLKKSRENQNIKDQAEQQLDARFLELREQIRSTEDLRLQLQQKQLLIYTDLAPLKERELHLIKRLSSLSLEELESDALRNEINEYHRLYNEYELGFDEKSLAAQKELARKQRQLKETQQLNNMEISAALRFIEDMMRNPQIQGWYGTTLAQYKAQLIKLSVALQSIRPEPEYLQTSLYLTENIKRMVRRIRARCDSFRDTVRNLSTDTDTPDSFLYIEPYYFRFPEERIPKRILERIKYLTETEKM